jgi:hypothetical protein
LLHIQSDRISDTKLLQATATKTSARDGERKHSITCEPTDVVGNAKVKERCTTSSKRTSVVQKRRCVILDSYIVDTARKGEGQMLNL